MTSTAARARAARLLIGPESLGLRGLREEGPGRWVAICPAPAHDDHDPSCSIRRMDDGLAFYCFSCGWGGSVLDAIAALNGLGLRGREFGRVVEVAEELAGIREGSGSTSKPEPRTEKPAPKPAGADLPEWNDEDARVLERVVDLGFIWTDGDEREKHLARWGLSRADTGDDVFLLPPAGRIAHDLFVSLVEEVGREALERTGLVHTGDREGFTWDEHRLAVVWRDAEGRPVNVFRRLVRELRAGEPKHRRYVGANDKHVRGRPVLPFGAHWLRQLPDAPVFVVEGAFDAFAVRAIARAEGNDVVALGVPGTGRWDPAWARLVGGRTLYIATDSDEAGESVANQIELSCGSTVAEWHRVTPAGDGDWADTLVRHRSGENVEDESPRRRG